MTIVRDTTDSLDFDRCYRAVSSRDTRFDGQFFVAVHTTGIYCRPSCPAQTPRPQNLHFVLTAAAAQQQGFRACRRCSPDAVPGSPLWNTGADLSSRAMRLIADGVVQRDGVEGLAGQLGYTPRHLNRVLTDHLGAGPLALARAHRAGTARVLIQCTSMPMAEIAFAAGFRSIRQFNDTIREIFGTTPTRLRTLPSPSRSKPARAAPSESGGALGEVTLRLAHRHPLDHRWLHWFLAAHAVEGTERVDDTDTPGGWRYRRTVALPHGPALVTVEPTRGHVTARIAHLDMRDLGVAVNRVRRLLDLDADPVSTDAALAADPALAPLVARAPGLRVPGTMDPSETLIRTMIGQQISVKAARHHVSRLVAELGRPAPWHPIPDPGHIGTEDAGPGATARGWKLFPDPATIAEHGHRVLTGPQRRIDAIISAAGALADGSVEMHAGCDASALRADLRSLAGVGQWTADYVAMRVTGDPDIMLDRDLVVARAAADLGIDLASASVAWSPWRSYASMHLWRHRLSETEAILVDEIPIEPMSTKHSTRAPSPRSPITRSTSSRREHSGEPAEGAR